MIALVLQHRQRASWSWNKEIISCLSCNIYTGKYRQKSCWSWNKDNYYIGPEVKAEVLKYRQIQMFVFTHKTNILKQGQSLKWSRKQTGHAIYYFFRRTGFGFAQELLQSKYWSWSTRPSFTGYEIWRRHSCDNSELQLALKMIKKNFHNHGLKGT